jgi:DNA invertase Pin-like site-specific DNA recombinase
MYIRDMIAAYTRVSTGQQATSGLGLEAQEAAIRGWIASKGIDASVSWHQDAGRSGRRESRPALEAAIRELEAAAETPPGGIDSLGAPPQNPTLIVYSLDRLTRSVVHLGRLMARLARSRISLVVLREGVDTGTAHGRLVATILVSVAEWESEMASSRTKAARAVVRSRGGSLGGRPRCPAEHVETVRSATGTLEQRRAALTAAGYRTTRGTEYSLTQVRRMLKGAAA